ncbi:Uncharacterized protein HZ326_13993 [Fusarium oxysporum f. sp. albedinis]|nr:Uncharacterized protein HZ326_13993 [Fusarium oxysporum f. sp. albedinis]
MCRSLSDLINPPVLDVMSDATMQCNQFILSGLQGTANSWVASGVQSITTCRLRRVMSVMTLHLRSIANPWRVSFISLNTKGGQSSVNDTRIFLNGMLPHSPVHSSHCRTQIALLQVATRPNGLLVRCSIDLTLAISTPCQVSFAYRPSPLLLVLNFVLLPLTGSGLSPLFSLSLKDSSGSGSGSFFSFPPLPFFWLSPHSCHQPSLPLRHLRRLP